MPEADTEWVRHMVEQIDAAEREAKAAADATAKTLDELRCAISGVLVAIEDVRRELADCQRRILVIEENRQLCRYGGLP